jgi:hypothetical protein
MSKPLDIEAARSFFAAEIGGLLPKAEIQIRPANNEATAFHCDWLIEGGPSSRQRSREITVKLASAAMNRFRSVDSKERGAMAAKFIRTIKVRLAEGGYDEKDPPSPPFIVHVDEHSLEP